MSVVLHFDRIRRVTMESEWVDVARDATPFYINNFVSVMERFTLMCLGYTEMYGSQFCLPDNVDEFSVKVALFTGRLCPNGLRKLFGLNRRRLCCGGVAHE